MISTNRRNIGLMMMPLIVSYLSPLTGKLIEFASSQVLTCRTQKQSDAKQAANCTMNNCMYLKGPHLMD